MADNNNGNGGMNLGEIGMIRNILMGEHINNFEQQFQKLQDQVEALENRLNDKIAKLDDATQKSFGDMQKSSDAKFEDIQKQLMANVEKLNNTIDKVSAADKMKLGKMLDKVSKQLMGE